MLQLNDEQLQERLGWPQVLSALEQAFRVTESFDSPERTVISVGKGVYLTMPCADSEGWFGVKQVSFLPDNPQQGRPSIQAWYTLFDPGGTPSLSCSATLLTRFRTSAVSALAARYLATQDATTLLVVGTGSLAPWMAEAHSQVRTYREVLVWGRDPLKAGATAEAVATRLSARVQVAEDLAAAAAAADVITVATSATDPIVTGAWLTPEKHLDLVGAFTPEMVEADPEAVTKSDVFIDDLDAARTEAGDLLQAADAGWSFEEVRGDLSDLVAGKVARGNNPTLFKSVGLAFEDLVVARLLLA
jgi:ornithine cyclodeaminase